MSDPGKVEGLGKPPKQGKKPKKEGEGSPLTKTKAIIGKIHISKKSKKSKDEAEGSTSSPTTKTPPAMMKLGGSGKTSQDFIGKETNIPSSTPVKESPILEPKPVLYSEKLKEAEKKSARELSPIKQDTPAIDKVETKEGEDVPKTSPDELPKVVEVPKEEKLTDNKVEEESDNSSMETAISSAEPEAQNGLKKECLYKILVIGELGTGKTSIIKRYVHQFFSQHYRATIGVDFALKVLNWDQNTIIRLQLWDIAGQERFGNMTRVYYKEAVGAFIVFDVTRAATFDAVVKWKQDLDAKVQLPDGSPIPCVLLANKCDQQKEGIVNNPNKMNEYCDEHKFTAWFETSAKENINIEEAAKTLVDQIVRNDSSNENGRNGSRDLSKFPLESTDDFTEGKSCSC